MNLLNDIRILLTRWSTAFVLLGVLAVAMARSHADRGRNEPAGGPRHHLQRLVVRPAAITALREFHADRPEAEPLEPAAVGALLLHYGFVVILAGAFITHMWGEEGYMHIREGETARRMMTPDRKVQTLPFSVTLNRFTLHRYHGSQSPVFV